MSRVVSFDIDRIARDASTCKSDCDCEDCMGGNTRDGRRGVGDVHIHLHGRPKVKDKKAKDVGYSLSRSETEKKIKNLKADLERADANGDQRQIRQLKGDIEHYQSNLNDMNRRSGDASALFSQAQIEALRKEYGTLKGIDPASPNYTKLVTMLNGMQQETLKQLAGADIPFVSSLARNRVRDAAPAFKVGDKVSYDMDDGSRGNATVERISTAKGGSYYIKTEKEGTILVPEDELRRR